MTAGAPVFTLTGVAKPFGGPQALRISQLQLGVGDRIVLSGLEPMAAEMLIHILTGAALPEEGRVEIFGKSTHDIKTDTEWLESLDRFGLVSTRAVLLDQSTIAQNLALPLTLSIDPMAGDVRAEVERMAEDVGLPLSRLDTKAGDMNADERMRAHLARAIATKPVVLLLEHPTTTLGSGGAAFGDTLRTVSDARRLSWLAISDDEAFARASRGRALRLNPPTGDLKPAGGFWRRLFTS